MGDGAWYCIRCGASLQAEHRFCWRCGAERWEPEHPALPASPRRRAEADLGLLPWIYAGGAVFFLILLTQELAHFVSPAGRAQLLGEMSQEGIVSSARPSVLLLYGILVFGLGIAAAALHGAAFYGLRWRRRWGWLSATVVASFWSLILVGIPVLMRLASRPVRESFGID